MILTDICPDIYVINLLRRTDRFEKVQAQSKKFGFPFIITCAVDAREVQNPTKLRDGEHALLLSHARVINWAKSRNLESVIVFEDDFECVENFNERLAEFKEIPADWDVVYLGGNHSHLGAGNVGPTQITENVMRVYSTFTTHAMLINKSMYGVVLDKISQLSAPLDVIYCDIQKKYNCYAFSRNLCKQYDSYSDIIGFDPEYNKKGIYD